jgi:hypothetical protein
MTSLLQFTRNSEKTALKLFGLLLSRQSLRRLDHFCMGRNQVFETPLEERCGMSLVACMLKMSRYTTPGWARVLMIAIYSSGAGD